MLRLGRGEELFLASGGGRFGAAGQIVEKLVENLLFVHGDAGVSHCRGEIDIPW